MALVVTFTGKASIPITGSGTAYKIWSYRIEASSSGELPGGQRIALGLPSDLDVQNPDSYPSVPQLAGTFVQHDPTASRQFVGRVITAAGPQTISFVAPAAETTCELLLVRAALGQPWDSAPFATTTGGTSSPAQVLPGPAAGPPVFNGRPLADFAGTLPYASEVFGVYQPLVGWFGANNTLWAASGTDNYEIAGLNRETFSGEAARTLSNGALAALAEHANAAEQGVLTPVGLVNLFREYFFEFDTFLGGPAGHLWISPGGTVEVVETSTRRTLIEKVAEQAQETSRKVEEGLTEQDEVADAVKEENANDTKLGVSATGGVNAGIYHGDASASFSTQNTIKRSSEDTHKHTRTQSAKVTSEIKRNFKTTFKTVTETTDTSSRRYVVQNTGDQLVNYELRRKMRKVGVQLQHIGTRLSWQIYLDDPGRDLGLGDMVHVVQAPDLTSINKPEPPPPLLPKETTFVGAFPIRKYPNTSNDPHINMNFAIHAAGSDRILDFGTEFHLVAKADFFASPPAPEYTLSRAIVSSAKSGGVERAFVPEFPIKINDKTGFTVLADFLNTGDLSPLLLTFNLTWNPPATDAAHDQYELQLADYNAKVVEIQREAYANAIRDRVKLVSSMRPRPSGDLRNEERQTVYGALLRRLARFADQHLNSELIRQIFDVDEMLYFVAPDFWRPSTTVTDPNEVKPPHPTRCSVGRYPVPRPPGQPDQTIPAGQTVASWYSHTDIDYAPGQQKRQEPTPNPSASTPNPQEPIPCPPPIDEWRVNYLITEESQPAPMGSSLGWLIQIDGDQRRNEFLNAAWAKAVLPVRPGLELAALTWLRKVHEGETALGMNYPFDPEVDPPEYQGLKVGEVLEKLATRLRKSNTEVANVLAAEEVFETGFDPLAGGFRPAEPYQVFDQWVEVLPTDQVVALQVRYDPKTGQQL
jgi:hypothetical protein